MGKGRTSFYTIKGETLSRTHTFCPKCGPGVVLAIHGAPHARRSCGKCGYSEAEKAPAPPGGKSEKPVKAPRAPKPAPPSTT